jgi:hypothetical protein
VELDEPVQRRDRVVVAQRLVMGIGGHQLGAGRPLGIGVLALDLVELLGGVRVVAVVEFQDRALVDLLDGTLDIGRLVRGRRAGGDACRQGRGRQQAGPWRAGTAFGVDRGSGGMHAAQVHRGGHSEVRVGVRPV